MDRPWRVIELPDCFQKEFDDSPEGQHAFFREAFFYANYSDFAPQLISAEHLTLSIEKCVPLIRNSAYCGSPSQDAAELWGLVNRLARRGARHGDINLANVVRHPSRGLLLIDWEKASLHRGVSQDLFPDPPLDPVEKNLVCWDGPWACCPGLVFGVSAQEMLQLHPDR